MAKKNKNDEIEDNDINKDGSDDLNEADDNFGLPDVDYEPIERREEEEEVTYEPEETAYSSTKEESTYEEDEYDRDAYEPAVEETAYVPGSYTPPKDHSMVPKIIALVLVVLLAGAAIWYLGFYRPEQQAIEKAQIEKKKMMEEKRRQEAEARAERDRLAEEQARREAEERAAAEAAAEPTIGTIETISSRTGRYYVVIASAVDEDLAMDHAKKLSKQGVSTKIIEPFGKSLFHRITVDDYDTWAEAQSNANDLKNEYGEGVWVIRY